MSVQKPEGATLITVLVLDGAVIIFYIWTLNFLKSISYMFVPIPFKQNEENKKKNKRAALKAQLELEEARKAASQTTEQQKDNNTSPQDLDGENYEKAKWKGNTRIFLMGYKARQSQF